MEKTKAKIAEKKLREKASELNVEKLSSWILDQKIFINCSGSSSNDKHHYGDHGLVMHTYEVVRSCMILADFYTTLRDYDIDYKILFLAALFHDSGKTRDYEFKDGSWQSTGHHHKIHHIPRSVLLFNKAMDEVGDENLEYLRDEVTHVILSHHGRREWRSPVQPSTREAWILHLSDSLSARLDDLKGDY